MHMIIISPTFYKKIKSFTVCPKKTLVVFFRQW